MAALEKDDDDVPPEKRRRREDVRNRGVDLRAEKDRNESEAERVRSGLEEKSKLYERMMSGDGGEGEYLVDFERKRAECYSKDLVAIEDEFGRTLFVPENSGEYHRYLAEEARKLRIREIASRQLCSYNSPQSENVGIKHDHSSSNYYPPVQEEEHHRSSVDTNNNRLFSDFLRIDARGRVAVGERMREKKKARLELIRQKAKMHQRK